MQLFFRGFMDKFGVVIAVCDDEPEMYRPCHHNQKYYQVNPSR